MFRSKLIPALSVTVRKGCHKPSNLFSACIDATINSHFPVSPYYGYAAGKSVLQAIY
jgi:hypothetical protein